MRTILGYCFDAGENGIVLWNAGLTLRDGDREYYYRALDLHFPGLSAEYRERYGNAYEVNSPNSDKLMQIFRSECEKRGVIHNPDECFRYIASIPKQQFQMSLFDTD